MGQYCVFIKPDGEQCRARPLQGDLFCLSHSPDPKAQDIKAQAVRKGGRARGKPEGIHEWNPRPIESQEDLRIMLSDLANAGMKGDIPTARLSALASVANSLSKVLVNGEEEKRLSELESLVGLRL